MDDGIQITALAFFPGSSENDAIAGDHKGRLYVSQDSGTTWLQSRQIANAGAITSIAISPGLDSDDTFFVGTERSGIFKTIDGGESYVEANRGLPFSFRQKHFTFRTTGTSGPLIRKDEKNVLSIALSPTFEADGTVFATL